MTDRSLLARFTTDWLADHLNDPDLVVLDGKLAPAPDGGRDAQRRIRGSAYPRRPLLRHRRQSPIHRESPCPTCCPRRRSSPKAVGSQWASAMTSKIVVYDSQRHLFIAARLVDLQDHGGRRTSYVLDGGLPAWKADDRLINDWPVTREPQQTFIAALRSLGRAQLDPKSATTSPPDAFQLVDARPAGALPRGSDIGDRATGSSSGRVPGSYNVPPSELVVDGRLKDARRASARLSRPTGVDLSASRSWPAAVRALTPPS